jgi:hypothetical protein
VHRQLPQALHSQIASNFVIGPFWVNRYNVTKPEICYRYSDDGVTVMARFSATVTVEKPLFLPQFSSARLNLRHHVRELVANDGLRNERLPEHRPLHGPLEALLHQQPTVRTNTLHT